MKLRRLLTPVAPVVLAALALSPLAVTTSATAGGIPTNHNLVYPDTDEAAVTTKPVDIVSTHLLRTANDYRAIVTFKKLTKLPSSRWTVAFMTYNFGSGDRGAKIPGFVSGNVVDYRVNGAGVASTLAYGVSDWTLVKSSCQGNSVTPNYAKNTLTFVINKNCWYSQYSPSFVTIGSKHYDSVSQYNQGSPTDNTDGEESATSDVSYPSDGECGWDWGGPGGLCISFKDGRAAAGRLHM